MSSRIFFDTEFIDDGVTIDLISIGMVRESDGAEYYAQNSSCDLTRASSWIKENQAWKRYLESQQTTRKPQ